VGVRRGILTFLFDDALEAIDDAVIPAVKAT
jgi:hypothetical protein